MSGDRYTDMYEQHCYESRIPNERWNIPLEEQHKTSKKKEQISAIHLEILLGRIREKQGEGDKIWECIQCEESYRAEKEIFGHIGKKHPETTTGRAICPYCFLTLANVANLKIHIRKKICPNMRQDITPDTWEEITDWNPLHGNENKI